MRLLAGLALLEAGLLAVGLIAGQAPALVPVPGAEPLPPATTRPAAPDRETLAAGILARPLFAPGRRPNPPSPSDMPDTTLAPRLTGIVVGGGVRRAVFALSGRDQPVSAGEGERVGAFHVSLIRTEGVVIDGPAGRQLLRTTRDTTVRDRADLPPVPLIDPDRREAETENDQ